MELESVGTTLRQRGCAVDNAATCDAGLVERTGRTLSSDEYSCLPHHVYPFPHTLIVCAVCSDSCPDYHRALVETFAGGGARGLEQRDECGVCSGSVCWCVCLRCVCLT